MIDLKNISYGLELEWGDVGREVVIPKELGSWDYSEVYVTNMLEPYKYIASDPLGINPPVGGEINTFPTVGISGQLEIFNKLLELFKNHNYTPTVSVSSNLHIHVHVPGLIDDINSLKKFMIYVRDNQEDAILACHKYEDYEEYKEIKKSKSILKYTGGRRTPSYIVENILDKAVDFQSFIKMHYAGKDGISTGRPIRFAINTYNLKHIKTIEFRFFRGCINPNELKDCLKFIELFVQHSLTDGKSVKDILSENNFTFPEYINNKEAVLGWLNTKYDNSRGKKVRRYIQL